MQSNEYGVLLSASDLMRFAGCAHATTLDLARMRGTGAAPAGDSEDAELLQRHGDAHEARHLARLRAAGRGVVEIVREGVSLEQGVGGDAGGAGAGRGGRVPGRARRRHVGRLERLPRTGRAAVRARRLVLRGRRHQAEAQAASEARAAARALLRPPRRRCRGWRRSTPTSSSATARGRRSASPRSRPTRGGCAGGWKPSSPRPRRPGRFPAPTARSAAGARSARRGSPGRTASSAWRTSLAGRWRSWRRQG